MSAKGGLGIEIAEIPLDLQAGNGVSIVTAPNLRAVAQHTKIKSVTAGSTGFQQHIGTGFEDPAQYIVKSQNIAVSLFSQGNAVAIHIPLHIGNIGIVQ